MSARVVPFLDLSRQYATLKNEIQSAVSEVLESQRFILGPQVETLERDVAALCGARHGVGVASGTDALILALQALDIGPGDGVVTSPFSFFATASAIVRAGARPIFADIEPSTFNLDPAALDQEPLSEAKGMIPVHIFGQCAEVERLVAAAQAVTGRTLPVVEDAAQAIGATRHGRPVGALGEAGCLSFYPTKNLGGAGDGGMVVTNDEGLAARVRRLRAHGDVGRYDHRELGMNSRLDSIQAAILHVKLRHLAGWNEARRRKASAYDALLAGVGDDLVLPATAPGNEHVYHQYVVRTRRRDDLARHLEGRGIGTGIYYPVPLHLQPCFAHLRYREGDFPRAEAACREVLALPLYPELKTEEQEQVAEAIRGFFHGTGPG